MIARPKTNHYRCPAILNAARHAPHCMDCDAANVGNVVAAHSNQLADGKGKSIKAHDYRIAYLCDRCHHEIDFGQQSREEKRDRWERAHRRSIGWLFDSGRIVDVLEGKLKERDEG